MKINRIVFLEIKLILYFYSEQIISPLQNKIRKHFPFLPSLLDGSSKNPTFCKHLKRNAAINDLSKKSLAALRFSCITRPYTRISTLSTILSSPPSSPPFATGSPSFVRLESRSFFLLERRFADLLSFPSDVVVVVVDDSAASSPSTTGSWRFNARWTRRQPAAPIWVAIRRASMLKTLIPEPDEATDDRVSLERGLGGRIVTRALYLSTGPEFCTRICGSRPTLHPCTFFHRTPRCCNPDILSVLWIWKCRSWGEWKKGDNIGFFFFKIG